LKPLVLNKKMAASIIAAFEFFLISTPHFPQLTFTVYLSGNKRIFLYKKLDKVSIVSPLFDTMYSKTS
jgi:hypothetical protein